MNIAFIYVLQTHRRGYRQRQWNPPACCSQRNSRRLGEKKKKPGYKTFSSSTCPLAIAAPPYASHSPDAKRSSSSGGNVPPLNRLNIFGGDGSGGCREPLRASHLMFIYTFCVTSQTRKPRLFPFLKKKISRHVYLFFLCTFHIGWL